jgi:DNA helicase-2/ATP-dependent DNA helicase PcrA
VTVVGDPNQKIFEFAGAMAKPFGQMSKNLAPVDQRLLLQNYRSSRNIVDLGNLIISEDKDGAHTDHFTTRAAGNPIGWLEFATPKEEAQQVADEVQKVHLADPAARVLIVARTNKALYEIEAGLLRNKVRYVAGQKAMFGQQEVGSCF